MVNLMGGGDIKSFSSAITILLSPVFLETTGFLTAVAGDKYLLILMGFLFYFCFFKGELRGWMVFVAIFLKVYCIRETL